MIEIGQQFTWRGNGNYTACSGHEGTLGICWWCGKPHEKKTQCCGKECREQYAKHFDWNYASSWALDRAGFFSDDGYHHTPGHCQGCGKTCGRRAVEVHHIVPINGGKRFYSVLNCPCVLIVLCLVCHNKTKKKFKEERQQELGMWVGQ
jgi:5-methylcytosine-specific restriction endonuclease McrA